MITIKLKLTENVKIQNYLQQYNNVVHVAYNRWVDGLSQSNIEKYIKNKINNIDLLDASFIKAAVDQARSLKDKPKVIFGGKNNWDKYNKGLITKQQYLENKYNSPLMVRGSTQDNKGNRKFQIDMENNQIIFKPKCKTKICAKLPKTKYDQTLKLLQQKCEDGETFFTCRINNEYIWIIFDETILRKEKF